MILEFSSIILFNIFISTSLFAGVVKYDGEAFIEIIDDIEISCGNNFVFRDQHKDQVPPYLEGEVIKENFKGTKIETSLRDAKVAAKKGDKCIWFASSEKSKLEL